MTDTHAHYDDPRFDSDRADIIKTVAASGVGKIINAGATVSSSFAGQKLSREYDFFYFAAGVHPHDIKDAPEDYLNQLKALAADEKCVAIGECGLDFYYDHSPRELQKR